MGRHQRPLIWWGKSSPFVRLDTESNLDYARRVLDNWKAEVPWGRGMIDERITSGYQIQVLYWADACWHGGTESAPYGALIHSLRHLLGHKISYDSLGGGKHRRGGRTSVGTLDIQPAQRG